MIKPWKKEWHLSPGSENLRHDNNNKLLISLNGIFYCRVSQTHDCLKHVNCKLQVTGLQRSPCGSRINLNQQLRAEKQNATRFNSSWININTNFLLQKSVVILPSTWRLTDEENTLHSQFIKHTICTTPYDSITWRLTNSFTMTAERRRERLLLLKEP